jgi:hypothetical protein
MKKKMFIILLIAAVIIFTVRLYEKRSQLQEAEQNTENAAGTETVVPVDEEPSGEITDDYDAGQEPDAAGYYGENSTVPAMYSAR